MKTIWKYPLAPVENKKIIGMPKGAILLCVQAQYGNPCLWALVDSENPAVLREFSIRGTGHDARDVGQYVGTFQMKGGSLIFHLFDLGEM